MIAGNRHIKELVELRYLQQKEILKDKFEDRSELKLRTKEYFVRHLDSDLTAFVEVRDGTVIATCCLVITQLLPRYNDNGSYGTICNLYTLPKYRNLGIATKLLSECVEFAKHVGLCELQLEANNSEVISISEKLGFKNNKLNMVLHRCN